MADKEDRSHGLTRHVEGCRCVRCTGFEPGNDLAVTHGAASESRVRPAARNHRRKILRQLRLSPRDLDPIGRGYLDVYARTIAKVELIDSYIAEHGLIQASGETQPAMRVYVSLVNSARLALAKLEGHLRDRNGDPQVVLRDWIEALPESEEDGDASSA